MYEKPEKRDVMVETNPDKKYKEADVVKEASKDTVETDEE